MSVPTNTKPNDSQVDPSELLNNEDGDQRSQIQNIENGLMEPFYLQGTPVERFSLLDRMKKYQVPGVSMALIDNGKIVWVKTWGVCDVNSAVPVTPDTLFQAASMSKPVAAFAAMRMVDEGLLSLSTPINQYLKRWQLPSNVFTKQQPVTLQNLLSHTAGITVHGFQGYTQDEPHISAIDVLNGASTSNSPAVEVDTLPGTQWRYSGGGYTALQVAMEDVSGKYFPTLLETLLFTPLGMTNSLFQQPLPESYQGSAASGHHANGTVVPGRHNHHPELAAAGLWSTPNDFAKFILAVKSIALGEEGALLSPASGQDFLSVQAHGAGGPWGLGFGLHEKDGEVIGFHHDGDNVGFHGHMVGFCNGSGAVIMTNGDQGPVLIQELLAATAALYQWPVHQVKEKAWLPLPTEHQTLISGTYTVTIGEQTHKLKLKPVDDAVTGHALKLCCEGEPDVVFYLEKIKDKTLQFFAASGLLMSINCEKEQPPVLNAFGVVWHKELVFDPA